MANRFYETARERIEAQQAELAQQKAERDRRTAARHDTYSAALKAGVDQKFLPDRSLIGDMSDKEWSGVQERMGRMGYNPNAAGTAASAAINGAVSAARSPVQNSLSGRRSFTGFNQPQISGAGVTALVDSGTSATGVPGGVGVRRVAVTPNAEQSMSLKTGRAWDTMTRDQRATYLRTNPATSPQGGVVGNPSYALPPLTSRAGYDLVSKYQAPGTQASTRDARTGTEISYQPDLTAVQRTVSSRARAAGDAIAGETAKNPVNGTATPIRAATALTSIGAPTATTPSPAPVAVRPGDVLSGLPAPKFAADLNAPSPQVFPSTQGARSLAEYPVPAAPAPSGATQVGQAIRSVLPIDPSGTPRGVPGTRGESQLQPQPRGPDALVQAGRDFVGGLTGDPAKDAAMTHFVNDLSGPTGSLRTSSAPTPTDDLSKTYLAHFADNEKYASGY